LCKASNFSLWTHLNPIFFPQKDDVRPPAVGTHGKNTNKVNSELSLTNGQAHGDQQQASRVCTIL